ncbi:MAG: GntR family transcriptional regulator [Anaerolineae bacterium]|nr:GntR family transcriptional regulator [Anaerolineae bacterium]
MDASTHQLRPRMTKPASLSDQVYEQLRSSIINAERNSGEKLVELEIAAQMGTSQGPVREALQRLERDGLVERQARSATYISSISIDEMYELFSVRSVIEGFAIRRAAQKITPQQCNYLEDLILEMAQAGKRGDMITLAEYDMRFHQTIVECGGSAGLLRVWITLSSQIQRFVVQSHPQHYADLVEIGTRHQSIVTALRQQDAERAAQAVQEHIMLIWPKINFEGL